MKKNFQLSSAVHSIELNHARPLEINFSSPFAHLSLFSHKSLITVVESWEGEKKLKNYSKELIKNGIRMRLLKWVA